MQNTGMPCAWTIAGSDSSGGAGIQADIKTFSALRVWGCSIVTAVTAQGVNTIKDIWPVPPEMITAQFDALRSGFFPQACKTGMLATRETVEIIGRNLEKGVPLVVDPVMVSTSGRRLLEEDALGSFLETLVPLATVITPNLSEAAFLADLPHIESDQDIRIAGERICNLGPRYVLIKGGHAGSRDAEDILFWQDGYRRYRGIRYPYDPHGTGCCLSAAITAFLACGCEVEDAVARAKSFVSEAIGSARKMQQGWLVNPGK